jgi:hypothetical protein
MLSALCRACGFRRGPSSKLLAQPPPREPETGHSIGPTPAINTSRGILALLVLAMAPSLAMPAVAAGPLLLPIQPHMNIPIQPHVNVPVQTHIILHAGPSIHVLKVSPRVNGSQSGSNIVTSSQSGSTVYVHQEYVTGGQAASKLSGGGSSGPGGSTVYAHPEYVTGGQAASKLSGGGSSSSGDSTTSPTNVGPASSAGGSPRVSRQNCVVTGSHRRC